MEHLLENLRANDLQLTPADLNELDQAFSRITLLVREIRIDLVLLRTNIHQRECGIGRVHDSA